MRRLASVFLCLGFTLALAACDFETDGAPLHDPADAISIFDWQTEFPEGTYGTDTNPSALELRWRDGGLWVRGDLIDETFSAIIHTDYIVEGDRLSLVYAEQINGMGTTTGHRYVPIVLRDDGTFGHVAFAESQTVETMDDVFTYLDRGEWGIGFLSQR